MVSTKLRRLSPHRCDVVLSISPSFEEHNEHLHSCGTPTSNILGTNRLLPFWSGHKSETLRITISVTSHLEQSLSLSACNKSFSSLCGLQEPTQSLVRIRRGMQSPYSNVWALKPREHRFVEWQMWRSPSRNIKREVLLNVILSPPIGWNKTLKWMNGMCKLGVSLTVKHYVDTYDKYTE